VEHHYLEGEITLKTTVISRISYRGQSKILTPSDESVHVLFIVIVYICQFIVIVYAPVAKHR